jgi:hypothetical protein
MINGLPDDALRRIREFLQRKTPGQIVLNVDGGGRVVHVQLTEHIRFTGRESAAPAEKAVPMKLVNVEGAIKGFK